MIPNYFEFPQLQRNGRKWSKRKLECDTSIKTTMIFIIEKRLNYIVQHKHGMNGTLMNYNRR